LGGRSIKQHNLLWKRERRKGTVFEEGIRRIGEKSGRKRTLFLHDKKRSKAKKGPLYLYPKGPIALTGKPRRITWPAPTERGASTESSNSRRGKSEIGMEKSLQIRGLDSRS